MGPERGQPDVLLVGCVKTRRSEPALAKDLFTSDYFSKMRTHAEATGRPWYIVTAEHGVVDPDQWLEPYALCLADLDICTRREWGVRVAGQLEGRHGSLQQMTFEIHFGRIYVDAIGPALQARGATILDPLEGLSIGRRLAWYRATCPGSG